MPEIAFGEVKVAPPLLEDAKKIGDCLYAPVCALKMYRVQVTYTRSRNGLDVLLSTAIHSLSLRIAGEVVGLMNVGADQLRLPPENVPRLTVTVFGALVRLNPRPA